MALNFDFRKTTLSVISEISSAFQNTFCFYQEPFHGRETQFSVTCKFWVHWVFLEISIFSCRVWPLCQNDPAEHFFQVWKKIKLSLIFLCVGEARTSLTFFMKQNKFQLGPPWKMMTNQNFHCLSNPLFFCLRINFSKSVITQSINIRDLLTFEPFDRF